MKRMELKTIARDAGLSDNLIKLLKEGRLEDFTVALNILHGRVPEVINTCLNTKSSDRYIYHDNKNLNNPTFTFPRIKLDENLTVVVGGTAIWKSPLKL